MDFSASSAEATTCPALPTGLFQISPNSKIIRNIWITKKLTGNTVTANTSMVYVCIGVYSTSNNLSFHCGYSLEYLLIKRYFRVRNFVILSVVDIN